MKRGKSCSITGINGFLGSALNKRLTAMGWKTYPTVRPDVDYLFLFGSPSSNHWFKQALSYSLRETIDNFISAADFCCEHNIKLVYPTSGTVDEGTTPYAKCKKILDILASIYTKNILGVRIFASYGVGEEHKKEYASIAYLFVKDMKQSIRPVIWGDGKQTRDFIYIDDVIDNIIKYKDRQGLVEIGTGVSHSLREVVEIINKRLGTKIKPKYIKKPEAYIENTICKNPCRYKVSLEEGIQKIIDSLP
jgi:nucleoside-diphosphate-sugar epimerase